MTKPLTSICIATRDHATLLDRALESIFRQKPPFDFEVIVANDGSADETTRVLKKYPVKAIDLDRMNEHFPPRSRNAAFRQAKGEIIIQQSDEVLHVLPDTIERLSLDLKPDEFHVATVYNYVVKTGEINGRYTPTEWGYETKRPLLFLGSHWKKDVYAIGGYSEDFTMAGWDDVWFADCLMLGLKLTPFYSPVLGLHQDHWRPEHDFRTSEAIYRHKHALATLGKIPWEAIGGPWDEK